MLFLFCATICWKSAISWEYLPFHLYQTRKDSLKLNRTSLRQAQGSAEERAILYALDSTKYNKAKAADLLGIHRSLLYKKMKKYDLPLKKGGFPYIQPETLKKNQFHLWSRDPLVVIPRGHIVFASILRCFYYNIRLL